MESFKSLIKGEVYTLSEIENTGIKFIKQTYTGRFYREGNILLVFEEIPERAENKYKLKAIIED